MLGIGDNWKGMVIVAGVFIFNLIMYAIFGNLGSDWGSLWYILPSMGGMLYYFIKGSSTKKKV